MSETFCINTFSHLSRKVQFQVRFLQKQAKSKLLQSSQHDVRTTTESNLRNILLLTSVPCVERQQPSCVSIIHYNVMEDRDRCSEGVDRDEALATRCS